MTVLLLVIFINRLDNLVKKIYLWLVGMKAIPDRPFHLTETKIEN